MQSGKQEAPALRRGENDWLSIGMSSFLGTVFIVAAVLKAHDPSSMTEALPALLGRTLAAWHTYTIVAALVAVELILGGLLVSRWRIRLVALVSAVLLSLFTLGLLKLAIDPAAPACGCFGSLAFSDNAKWANYTGMIRNVALIVGCFILIYPGATKNADKDSATAELA